MENIVSGIIANAAWFFLFAVMVFSLTVLITLAPGQRRKMRLFRFLGVDRTEPTLTAYLSTMNVVDPRSIFTFRYRSGDPRTMVGSFTGPVSSVQELNTINFLQVFLQDPLAGFPSFLRQYLTKRLKRFRPLRLVIAASPLSALPNPDFRFSSLLAVGSPTYNSISDYYANHHPGYLRFNARASSGIEVLKGPRKGERIALSGDPSTAGRYAILEKIIDDDNKITVFVAAGSGAFGTAKAVQYLAQNWQNLAQRYGTKPFAAILEFEPTSLEEPRLLKQDWFPAA